MSETERLRDLLRQVLPYAEQQILGELYDGGVGMGAELKLLDDVRNAVKGDPIDDFEVLE